MATTDHAPPIDYAPPLPRILTYPSAAPPPVLVAQGAEARLYRTTFLTPDCPCALKYRPPKPYRHPVLDARLTRQRILAEARILNRCLREGVPVPALYAVDLGETGNSGGGTSGGSLLTEWIDGGPVRARLNTWLDARPANAAEIAASSTTGAVAPELASDPELLSLMHRIGKAVGSLHRIGIVHGDLTTSNLMLRGGVYAGEGDADVPVSLSGEIVVIDFGLASTSTSEEDRAVDLYVLERAFGSTHPRAEGLFDEVLKAYRGAFKQAGAVLKKLEDVRMRGRKRSMLG